MKSKMVATAGLSLTLDPMGKMFQNAKVDRNSKMTTTARHSFYIGPIDSFYYQVIQALESLRLFAYN
jgi:hypothetical protein